VWIPSRAAAERRARRRSTYFVSINVWAFVSVMLALLWIVMGDITTDQCLLSETPYYSQKACGKM
jgi:biopolymer transport protein ExbD